MSNTLFAIALIVLFYFAIPASLAAALGLSHATGWLIGVGVLIGHLTSGTKS